MSSYKYIKFNRDGTSSERTGIVREDRKRIGKTAKDRKNRQQ